ncbi:MAG: hypothetical protein FJ265_07875 [Planctomycetes bacterium]|nr:hypothetical protein [Planctomycetota bacterium]
MKSMPKWLLVPPAVGLLLVLGPLSMRGPAAAGAVDSAAAPASAADPAPAPATDLGKEKPVRPALQPVRGPDLWQAGSALAAVLLLGTGGVLLLRRLRGGATPVRGAPLATLRQTLRLSSRQAVHAIEFDDRILLVGEHERGLVLLDSGRPPERAGDEAEVLARGSAAPAAPAADEDGATPRDLVIPRPERPGPRRLPAPPVAPGQRATPGLGDFRTLLQKAGRA